jgi:cation:H+ antiporter
VGITLLAVGTDLPEMANSIVSSVRGHGDLNVSDSMGSTATQITLVLGMLPLFAGAIITGRRRVRVVGGLTALALAVGIFMVSDGRLSRVDGIVLVALWVVASLVAWRLVPASSEPVLPVPSHHKMRHLALALGGLALVGAGSWVAVEALVRVAEGIDVPLYVVGFLGAALGTSLPELIVDITALRRGQRDLAIGDVFGSSLVDATLSIGIGPIVAPTFVDQTLGVRGGLVALGAVLFVTVLLGLRRRHTRLTGVVLIAVYLLMTVVISLAG